MKTPTRVFALSDVHADYDTNMAWLHNLSATDYVNDALILAGDISDDLDKLEAVFSALLDKFYYVFFVPGNHDLWVRNGTDIDSRTKLQRVCQRCEMLGVKIEATKLGHPSDAV